MNEIEKAIKTLEKRLNRYQSCSDIAGATKLAIAALRERLEHELLTLPSVPERDKKSMYDFLFDCFAEWIHDPSAGLRGMNEGEAILANAIMDAIKPERSEG